MFTAKDARKATGMEDKKPTFDRWMAATIARPTVTSRGSGYPAEWSAVGILALELTKRLGAVGMDLRIAASIAELATEKPDFFSLIGWEVVVDLETKEFKPCYKTGDDAEKWRKDRDMVVIFDMNSMEKTLAKRLGMELREFMEVK